jgi:hypothetical protein
MEEQKGRRWAIPAINKKTAKVYAVAALLYLLIALAMFYPITLNMGSATPGSGSGSYQNLWEVWWVNYALLHLHASVYYTSLIFYPLGVSLAYQTMPLLAALVSAPFLALGTVFAYNIMFFIGFALSGITMFLLADYLVKNRYAALIAGLVFAFSTFHIAQAIAHVYFINIEFAPLFLYFLMKVVKERWSYANIIGMSASFALATLMGSAEQSVMLLVLLLLIAVIYAVNRPTRGTIISKRFASSMLLFAVIALLFGSWNFIPILGSIMKPGGLAAANQLNDLQHNAIWSHDLVALFIPSYYNGIFSSISSAPSVYSTYFAQDPTERVAYIGFTVIALSLYGLYRNRRHEALWLILAVVFGWLTLGPYIQIAGNLTPVPGPYYLYHLIPVMNVIKEPGRFDLIFTMMLSILAAFGAKALIERVGEVKSGKRMAYLVVVVLFLLVFIEGNGMPVGSASSGQTATQVAQSNLYPLLASLKGNFSILQLPALQSPYAAEATYYTSITHKPLVGGYSEGENISDELLLYNIPLAVQASNMVYSSPVTENYTNQTLLALYNYYTAFIVVTKSAYNQTYLSQMLVYMIDVFGAPVYNDNTTIAFQTSKAVNQSLFRSYVSYPIATDWSEAEIPFDGRYIMTWVPNGPGAILVYAPYASNTMSTASQAPQAVNTTISFYAIANRTSELSVKQRTPYGLNETIARLNITTSMRMYTVNTTLVSGYVGNKVFFVENQGYATVFINDTKFSRGI